jgi:putative CocE/NonD family hydrolase
MKTRLQLITLALAVSSLSAVGLQIRVSAQVAGRGQERYQFARCAPASVEHKTAGLKALYIRMKDGTRIAADVFLPSDLGTGVKLPAILTQTRYWRAREGEGPNGLTQYFIDHGYGVVNVDVRGTGASFGRWPYPWSPAEVRDAGDIVNWIIQQPWSNRKVGTIGTSYTANTAEFTAASQNPAVKAVVPRFSDFDIYAQLLYPGGIFNNFMSATWGSLVKNLDDNVKMGNPPRGVRPVDGDADGGLLKAAVQSHVNNPSVDEGSKEVLFRDDKATKWAASVDAFCAYTLKNQFDRSGIPIFGWAGWLDAGTQDGALSRFMTLKNPQRTVIGPWCHGGGFQVSPFVADHTARNPTRDAESDEALCFLDHYIKGNAPEMAERLLIYYTMGEEKWKTTKVWPVAGTRSERMYLADGNTLSRSAPAKATGADQYTVNFDATTGKGSNRWYTQMGGFDVIYPDRAEEDRKLLTYTSEPMTVDTEITGYPVVNLYVKSTAADGAFFAYMEDIDESGRVTYVTEGELRAIMRKLSTEPRPYNSLMPYHTFKRKDAMPLAPGKTALIKFGLFPTSVMIKKGHRLRIAISGADKDTFARIPAEGTPTITVIRDRLHPSYVELPVVHHAGSLP